MGDDPEEKNLVPLGRRDVDVALARGEFKVLGRAGVVALALQRLP